VSSTTVASRHWVIDDGDRGLEIDAGTYQLEVVDDGLLVLELSSGDGREPVVHEGRPFVVRDGRTVEVTEVTERRSGLDHVTLAVAFADGSTGRVEVRADGPRRIAVRVSPDESAAVTGRGTGLPPSFADLEP
jgi:hypothetical protein